MTRPALAAVAALLLAPACAARAEPAAPRAAPAAPARAPARVIVETAAGGRLPVRVEVARTEAERARGLMFRTALEPDAGMLFVFERSGVHAFWMKNTLIPLDMIFIDEAGAIVGIVERAEPLTEKGRWVARPSRYVLEVNGGWSAANGVRAGDRVKLENVLP